MRYVSSEHPAVPEDERVAMYPSPLLISQAARSLREFKEFEDLKCALECLTSILSF